MCWNWPEGQGGLGLAAAERVAPSGEVVLCDVTTEMTAIASARAQALGLATVSARELDLEHIEQPEGSFSVVLCRDATDSSSSSTRAAPSARCGECCDPVDGSRSRCGGPTSATPGSASFST